MFTTVQSNIVPSRWKTRLPATNVPKTCTVNLTHHNGAIQYRIDACVCRHLRVTVDHCTLFRVALALQHSWTRKENMAHV